MKRTQQLLWTMTDLGDDLIDGARRYRPPAPIWHRLLPVAACFVVILGLWQAGKQLRSVPMEPSPSSQETVLPPAEAVHILDVSDTVRRMIAVDGDGVPVAEAEHLEFITDRATGERLAILVTPVYGADSDWKSAERIVCDLSGRELHRLCARRILCVGNVAAVVYSAEKVSLYDRNGTLLQAELSWATAYRDCMAVGIAETGTRRYYGPDGTLLVDTLRDGVNQFDTYYGEQTLFYKRQGDDVGLAGLDGSWVVEPGYTAHHYIDEACVRCREAGGNWVLVSLETGEVLCRLGTEERYAEPWGPLLFCVGEDGQRWEDWNGNVIVPAAARARAVDADGDRTPELLLAEDLCGTVTCYEPDGACRLQVTGMLALEPLSAQKAAGIRETETGQTELRLIDLETGEELGGFSRNYQEVVPVLAQEADRELVAGIFYAWYSAENGERYADLIDENGTILLEQLRQTRDGAMPHIGGGVFRVEGGYRRIDGTWLYRE